MLTPPPSSSPRLTGSANSAIVVSDADSGDFARFRVFSLDPDFEVHPNISVIETMLPSLRARNVDALDYEKAKEIRVVIVAEAETSSPSSSSSSRSSATVVIEIQDANDNVPQFEETEYLANVAENATVGTVVVRIKVRSCHLVMSRCYESQF